MPPRSGRSGHLPPGRARHALPRCTARARRLTKKFPDAGATNDSATDDDATDDDATDHDATDDKTSGDDSTDDDDATDDDVTQSGQHTYDYAYRSTLGPALVPSRRQRSATRPPLHWVRGTPSPKPSAGAITRMAAWTSRTTASSSTRVTQAFNARAGIMIAFATLLALARNRPHIRPHHQRLRPRSEQEAMSEQEGMSDQALLHMILSSLRGANMSTRSVARKYMNRAEWRLSRELR